VQDINDLNCNDFFTKKLFEGEKLVHMICSYRLVIIH